MIRAALAPPILDRRTNHNWCDLLDLGRREKARSEQRRRDSLAARASEQVAEIERQVSASGGGERSYFARPEMTTPVTRVPHSPESKA